MAAAAHTTKKRVAFILLMILKAFQYRTHLRDLGKGSLEKGYLVAGADQIVLGIFDFVVSVAVDIVGKEAHGLHIREEARGIGQVLPLDGCEEHLGRLDVALCKCLEDIHLEVNLVHCRVVLRYCIGSCTQEIAEVGENEAGHDGIEVDDAENLA